MASDTPALRSVGLMLPTVADLDTGRVDTGRVLDAARLADAPDGFDGAYVGDHLVHRHPILEPIVTLSAVASVTRRLTIGTCVLLAALRRPVVLAKQLGSLAAFAPDRLRIGLGVGGEYREDFHAAGIEIGQRGERLDAAVTDLKALLNPDGSSGPALAPVDDVPLFFGGWSDAALARAARHGGAWVGYLLDEQGIARRRRRLAELTPDDDVSVGVLLPVHLTDAPADDARAEGAAHWHRLTGAAPASLERHVVSGGAARIVAAIERFVEAGCDEVILAPADQGHAHLEQVEALARLVLPRLDRAPGRRGRTPRDRRAPDAPEVADHADDHADVEADAEADADDRADTVEGTVRDA